ncbi:YwiC-like family protein [Schaalia sp. Marseille-Q2122]|uniref:YwiC-like family protein n=1 Tax=Schaalia sp. Marseille-Q2122 TaxID=2736604 RepID=UPI00158D6C05|nr:YwiC-like family protein [Schaalia sp. Marseille-Q2122]
MPKSPSPRTSRLRSLTQHGWIQDQHGAWPMALLPLLLGASLAGWQWAHLLLLLAWFAGFHFFNAATLFLKGRRSSRIRKRLTPALVTWGATSALLGLSLIAWYPLLLTWTPAFAPLVAVAFIEAWRRKERSIAARISTILASSLMLPLAYWLGVGTPGMGDVLSASRLHIWVTTGILAAYFVGTVPYVRSLIRGKNDHRWVWAATAWHALSTLALVGAAAYGLASWWMVALWVVLTARCLLVPMLQRRGADIRPAIIGISEFVATALLTALLLLPA